MNGKVHTLLTTIIFRFACLKTQRLCPDQVKTYLYFVHWIGCLVQQVQSGVRQPQCSITYVLNWVFPPTVLKIEISLFKEQKRRVVFNSHPWNPGVKLYCLTNFMANDLQKSFQKFLTTFCSCFLIWDKPMAKYFIGHKKSLIFM